VTRDEILATIRAHESELHDFGVSELALFGSFARGDAAPDSDIDFIVELEEKSFDNYMGVRELLERLFERRIDLVIKSTIKPRLKERILREAVRFH
jgi:uncharacterized protein